jgi:hypothetical protein
MSATRVEMLSASIMQRGEGTFHSLLKFDRHVIHGSVDEVRTHVRRRRNEMQMTRNLSVYTTENSSRPVASQA